MKTHIYTSQNTDHQDLIQPFQIEDKMFVLHQGQK